MLSQLPIRKRKASPGADSTSKRSKNTTDEMNKLQQFGPSFSLPYRKRHHSPEADDANKRNELGKEGGRLAKREVEAPISLAYRPREGTSMVDAALINNSTVKSTNALQSTLGPEGESASVGGRQRHTTKTTKSPGQTIAEGGTS